MKKIISAWKKRGILFVRKLDDTVTPAATPIEGFHVRRIESEQELAGLNMGEEMKAKIIYNIQPHKEVFVGIIDREVVNISFVDYAYPAGVMLFGDFTLPEFRGRHINPIVKTFIFNHLKKKGIRKVYISCSKDNLSSKASILRAGFRQLNLLERVVVRVKKWKKKIGCIKPTKT